MTGTKKEHLEYSRKRVEANGWRPRTCVWELTLECNLRCTHCGSRAGSARTDELTTRESVRVVGELASLGCELLTLSGGEPTLRDDWDTIARAATERGIIVNMVTNGIYTGRRTARDIARRAIEAGMSNVGVSVDGPRETHERVRGQNTYDRTLSSISDFAAEGLPVGILTTITKFNIGQLDAIHEIVCESGAKLWRLQLGKPMGTLSEHQDWVIAPRQVPELMARLAAFKKAGRIKVGVGDSIGYYGPHDRVLRGWGWRNRQETWQGCQAGKQAIGIQADGGVKGCLSLQARVGTTDTFVEGNIRDTSLLELWYKPGVFSYNRDFNIDMLSGDCRRCSKASVCRAGAKCVTSSLGFLSDNPYCSHRYESEGSVSAALRNTAAGAAAALWLGLGLGGCEKADDKQPVDTVQNLDSNGKVDTNAPDTCCEPEYGLLPDARHDSINCENVCCECDYGILPSEVREACCGEPDIQVEYGIPPDVVTDTTDDTGINCDNVCCECEYGILPQEVAEKCCGAVVPDVVVDTTPDTCCEPEYGVFPDVVQQDTNVADAIDCSSVCCDCEYGIIPEDVYKECCDPCKDVCCECDYGVPPPPECCNDK